MIRKRTILIVEDDENDVYLIERAFNKLPHNFELRSLEGAEQAIDYLKGEGEYADRKIHRFPSYIITDLKMGIRDGFHLLEFIDKNPALSIVPVVMLSASPDMDDVRNAYLLGASSYFVKPSQVEDIDRLIKSIHEYWSQCVVPDVDENGYALETDSTGKPGQRYRKPARVLRD